MMTDFDRFFYYPLIVFFLLLAIGLIFNIPVLAGIAIPFIVIWLASTAL